MISQVAINPRAIGYEIPWITRYHKESGSIKFLTINGYSPYNLSGVISTDYPLYRVYSFTTWKGENVENPQAQKLIDYLLQQVDHLDAEYSFIPASALRKAGWKFNNNELVGEPE